MSTSIILPGRMYVIAEAGVNHNGKIELAVELIKRAKECGADAVKFQTFSADSVVVAGGEKAQYQKLTTDPQESQREMLRHLELERRRYPDLKRECDILGIDFISTPYNFDDVDFLEGLGVSVFKLASMHVPELDMLRYVASKGKPIILSTGMAFLSEIDEAVRVVREKADSGLILLQCTTNYPTSDDEANLLTIPFLKNIYDIPVGYSDHTVGILAACTARALGAMVIEKHFTLDKEMEGPDHKTSADPEEFRTMVASIRTVERLLGKAYKHPTESEARNIAGMRRSVVLSCAKMAGDYLLRSDLISKRPGSGLSPKYTELFIGKKVKRNLLKDHQIQFCDIDFEE